ncbi:hypothetical protein LLS1_37270 [Leifsonia sp. LS1]|nr:hypothetical protein LLS1_37270 [Leifsonia sp. LS1]
MTDAPNYRDAIFRSPNGALARRIELVGGRPPQWIELPAKGRSGARDLYILAVNDPVRPVYRWQARQPGEAAD